MFTKFSPFSFKKSYLSKEADDDDIDNKNEQKRDKNVPPREDWNSVLFEKCMVDRRVNLRNAITCYARP